MTAPKPQHARRNRSKVAALNEHIKMLNATAVTQREETAKRVKALKADVHELRYMLRALIAENVDLRETVNALRGSLATWHLKGESTDVEYEALQALVDRLNAYGSETEGTYRVVRVDQ